MTWTATATAITRAPNDKRRMRVMVAYSNGTDSESRAHEVTSEAELTGVVASQLAEYERAESYLAAFAPGPIAIPAAEDLPAPAPSLPMEGFIGTLSTTGLLSKPTLARLRDVGYLADIRRDVEMNNRAGLRHWITVLNARDTNDANSQPIIPDDEAKAIMAAIA